MVKETAKGTAKGMVLVQVQAYPLDWWSYPILRLRRMRITRSPPVKRLLQV
jgi:hypothetical protein